MGFAFSKREYRQLRTACLHQLPIAAVAFGASLNSFDPQKPQDMGPAILSIQSTDWIAILVTEAITVVNIV